MKRLTALLAVVLFAGCGGGDREPGTLADWNARHGAAVTELGAALDRVAAATKNGEPVGIRTACAALRESLNEATNTPPVPVVKANDALRAALDATDKGVTDCLGAMAVGDARQLERSITQLKDARLKLDTANAALSAD